MTPNKHPAKPAIPGRDKIARLIGRLVWLTTLASLALSLSGCQAGGGDAAPLSQQVPLATPALPETPSSTPFPTRPAYTPGELVDYLAQPGDTLPALAVHFNTTVPEILAANPFIPPTATTMPPGMPMKIPIYYAPFWGTPYRILPDSLFVNGPAQIGFDVSAFVAEQPGWLNGYREYAFGDNRSGAEIVAYVALNYSISPRLLLAILEYQTGALSNPVFPQEQGEYLLGNPDWRRKGLYLQLNWAANLLNNGYYGWRSGSLVTIEHLDQRLERPDPWQNAATVALQYYYAHLWNGETYAAAIGPQGLAQVYRTFFGDPWQADLPHIPGSLQQPDFALPFRPGFTWAYTGGPHTAWGQGEPLAALDFAPGNVTGGCTPTDEWATAVAPGVIARSEPATVVLDLDGDGDERTGWVVFYYHVAAEGRVPAGVSVQTGDPLGHPSCEGGRTTGTHIHIARKYNGEWIPADGVLAFNLEGWIAHNGDQPYHGTLSRGRQLIVACECSNAASQIQAGK